MTPADPYAVLGVPADAAVADIRRAWLRLARANHPDHGGDPAAMQAVNEAWAVLGDPVRRRAWDREHGVTGSRATRTDPDPAPHPDVDLLDDTPLVPLRRSPTDLLPATLFAGAIAVGCLAFALDAPAFLAAAGFLFFLSCIAIAAVALLSMRRSVRGARR